MFFLLVYVDDIIIPSTFASMVDTIINSIHAKFELNDLGNIINFLGMEVTTGDDYLLPNQRKYIQYIIPKVGLSEASTIITCMIGTFL